MHNSQKNITCTTPLITTVLPTYRRPKLLLRAIQSVLNQTFRHFQICVYDNASEDETAQVISEVAKRDTRVKYHCHSKNIGAVDNINYGLKKVATPFFSILSDDDILLPNFYKAAMDSFDDYPQAMVFCSRTLVYRQSEKMIDHRIYSWANGYYEPSTDTISNMINDSFPTTGVVFRTSLRETVGLLNIFGSDHAYMAKAAGMHPLVVSDLEGAVFMTHPFSVSKGNGSSLSSKGTNFCLGPEYFIGATFSALTDMLNLTSIDVIGKIQISKKLISFSRRNLLYWCIFKSIPQKKPYEIKQVIKYSDFIRLSYLLKLILRIIEKLTNNCRTFATILALFVGWIIAVRRKIKYRPSAMSQKDIDLLKYIKELDECGINGC